MLPQAKRLGQGVMTTLFFQFSFLARLNLNAYLNTFRGLIQLQGRNHPENGISEQRLYKAVQSNLLAIHFNTNGVNFLLHVLNLVLPESLSRFLLVQPHE